MEPTSGSAWLGYFEAELLSFAAGAPDDQTFCETNTWLVSGSEQTLAKVSSLVTLPTNFTFGYVKMLTMVFAPSW